MRFRLHSIPCAVVLAGSIVGCNSSSDDNGTVQACTVSGSGGASFSGDCSVVLEYNEAARTTFRVIYNPENPAYTLAVDVTFRGAPATGTSYTTAIDSTESDVSVLRNQDYASWVQSMDTDSTTTDVGTMNLHFTGVGVTDTVSTTIRYAPHGIMDATLPAEAGSAATGTVKLHVAF